MNIRELQLAASLAFYTYKPEKELNDAIENMKKIMRHDEVDLTYIHSSGVDAFILRCKNTVFVIVRGTDGSFDWLTNSMVSKISFNVGKVHKGFFHSGKRLFSEVERYVDFTDRIIFIGHSLGAATVTVAGVLMENSGYENIRGVIALSSPRVGNKSFAQFADISLGDRLIRTQSTRDFVSRVPPFFLNYCHCGKHIYFDRIGRIHIKPSMIYQMHDWLMAVINDLFSGTFFKKIFSSHSALHHADLVYDNAHTILGKKNKPSLGIDDG
jgi:hypothetical protein